MGSSEEEDERGQRTLYPSALFIDFENILRKVQEDNPGLPTAVNQATGMTPDTTLTLQVLTSLTHLLQRRTKGGLIVSRAYGTWGSQGHGGAPNALYRIGVQPVTVSASIYKNSADIHLAIEATSLLYTHPHIRGFIIASGDRDFIPLVLKLREEGRHVQVAGIPGSVAVELQKLVGKNRFIDLNLLTHNYWKGSPVIQGPTLPEGCPDTNAPLP